MIAHRRGRVIEIPEDGRRLIRLEPRTLGDIMAAMPAERRARIEVRTRQLVTEIRDGGTAI